jgi:PAS domain S-box-containing protein
MFRQALVGIAECDVEGRFLAVNEQFCALTHRNDADLLGRRMHDLTDADDLEREAKLFGRAAAAGAGYVIEKRLVRPDGARLWVRNTVTPIVDRKGRVRRIAMMCEDITKRHNDEERQRLLMAELNHRVRNNLATIQAMARLTARGPRTKEQYVESLQGRIASMARTHSLLTRDRWQGASLEDIIRDELNAYGRPDAISISGPAIMLGTRHAIDLSLVVHELSTNAVKYGALSGGEGRIAVTWTNQIVDGEPHLMLQWRESGGPEVMPPEKKGFGSYLIESALAGGNTKVILAFPPEGVTCEIDMPLVRSAAQKAPAPMPAAPVASARQRILLVEDDAVLGFELQSALLEAGFDVVGPARTVQEALTLAGDRTLAGAVLDIHLGGLMVFPVAEYLRARGLPMLFITGYDIEAVAPVALRETPVMQKPVNAEKLAGRLKELIGSV